MFNKIKEVKIQDDTKIKELELKISQLKDEHQRELRNLKEDNERELKNRQEDFDSKVRILNNEILKKVDEAVKEKINENFSLKEENTSLKKEVSILQRAFENMGFDVKDMKDILNKLVDGVISKNTVNVIK